MSRGLVCCNKIISVNEDETFAWGESLGKKCQGGEVFLLFGDLGVGKTKLLQGLAKGLGVKGIVNSPTFNILKIYHAQVVKEFCHVDAYRLNSADDLESLGIQEFFDSKETVTAIEWAEKVKKIWPQGAKQIRIKFLSEKYREIISS
ncbi:tRNA (adenosine(37)-N6)-threonylcarbamoyltransferase complex ATPase subunit type 1 TsaE [Candidatus Falkowbacteria bacterium]|uniref:tRNA threonylcarbamoyladenosine biosynthesis protein TsaE n=1 Tax=Candidatus Falkowbacteria bacterium CG10_big_fil_rev_8_21_14_0_10_37_18 TaxID=1974562 RepID=A0A2H0VAA0_9BACT|nr:tRNA (adenosine(37)-N6)-threonylcarbamoyltransferase complex ATPase subunit type 1 TsaE [Candidatus Falkowbacteria bacterium]NCQ13111.1 tRNA (adenosine(37)-N6)-threonylcarbamoyltransferase complex ATPase subunit type 1 TsaE [Candidatus Falkowbacteria bacterium]OIO05852.1 MAG: tRNA (adenosine(37)-N6)-threonylcarbamoyltransferase complex ATPase subunit type 1 TsaE [Candidatus Falkowbacteria bacterium CG1_02_37_21]PIR95250.1 MAG: tRNA (adenosine(37)-N6)-threonylcarbamoyltransferase complex ATPas